MNKPIFNLLNILIRLTSITLLSILFLGAFTLYLAKFYEPKRIEPEVANSSLKQQTEVTEHDFIIDEGYELVVANCTNCHSAKLVTQNRATAEGWKNTIVWMQETQNQWDLGEYEDKIVAYLARNYAPTQQGRRKNLERVEWYNLEPEQ